jgi:hypothetical protein
MLLNYALTNSLLNMAHDKDLWRALVNTVINLLVHKTREYFLDTYGTISLPRRIIEIRFYEYICLSHQQLQILKLILTSKTCPLSLKMAK